jgi:hypothetical protein
MPPLNNDKEMSLYFERTYRWIPYPNGPRGLVSEASKWLSKVLDWEADVPTVQYVTPNGIGDVYWVLKRIKSIAKAEHNGAPIDIILSGNPGRDIDRRRTYFLKRFPFVRSATVRFYHKRRRRW